MSSRGAYARILAFDAAIGIGWLLLFNVLPELLAWGVLAGLHLFLPVFAARASARSLAWRGFWAGPGLVIGVYLILLIRYVSGLIGGIPEDTWLAWMLAGLCAVAIAVFALYAVFVTAYLQRYRRG